MQVPAADEPFSLHPLNASTDRQLIEEGRSIIGSIPDSILAAVPPAQEQPSAVGRFARMVARRFPLVVIATLFAIDAALIALHFATAQYTVSAQLMVQAVASTSQSPDDRLRVLRNEKELIVSTPVIASALSMPGVHDIAALRGRADALKLVKSQLRTDSGNGDDMINLSYESADAREGTRLVAAVIDSYVRFRSGLHGAVTGGSAAIVRTARQAAVQTLEQKRAQVQQFGKAHGLVQGDEQVDATNAVLHDLALRMAQAHVATVAAKAAYDQMQSDLANDPRLRDRLAQANENDSSLASGDDEQISKRICTLQTQLAGYGTKFMANYAPVQLIHRQIDDLKFTRDAIIQQRWQAAVRTEAALQSSYTEQQSAAASSESDAQSFEQCKADVLEAQKQIATFDQQLKELDSTDKLLATMVTVIDPASASDQPSKPHASMILAIASTVGLLAGLALAGIADTRSQKIPAGNLKMLGTDLPMLARLPAVPRMQLAMNSWRDRMVDSAAEFAEACRKIRAALEAVPSFAGGRTVLVTSTSNREGKSTLTSLLALTLAQTGKRVLLVDANLHAPAQGGIFGVDGEQGLGELLEADAEPNFADLVHPGTDHQMDVLLAGSATLKMKELLDSQRFTNLLAAMSAEYDYVLIDSPAMSVGADAQIIASSCDATIVLCSEADVNRKALEKTRDSLTSVGANVIGVVINGGMAAAQQPQELPTRESPKIEMPKREPMRVTTVGPMSNPSAVASPIRETPRPVFVSQVRREVDAAPDLAEERDDGERSQSIWSYALFLLLLIGGWMAFHAAWGMPGMPGVAALHKGRSIGGETAMPMTREPVAIAIAGAGLLVALVVTGFRASPPRREIAFMVCSAAMVICAWFAGVTSNSSAAQQSRQSSAFLAEAAMLFATLLFAWLVANRLSRPMPAIPSEAKFSTDAALMIFAQASIMSALMIVLNSWHSKGECLLVTACSACLATMLAYWLAPVRSSLWVWIGPFAVAIFGYTAAVMDAHGIHVGLIIALARPLPLDYAGVGPIGAMLGFWLARSARDVMWPRSFVVG